jgi:hypothetical protein
MTALALGALVLEHAAGLEGVEVVPVDDGLELQLDGDPFAAVSGGVAELCLRPVVAHAPPRPGDGEPPRPG